MGLLSRATPTDLQASLQQKVGEGVAAISRRLRETTAGGLPEDDTVTGPRLNNSKQPLQMLWIDGVGGYLMTSAAEIVIGQPNPEEPGTTLGVLADLSRRHARLSRQNGCYVLIPSGEAFVEGKQVSGPTVLEHGARFSLGPVEFLLRRPHALSASAVLTVESGHRLSPAADAVLLMAESCVLGSKPHSHIRSPDWTEEAILFRSGDRWAVRSTGEITVDGVHVSQPVGIEPGKRIVGQDLAFCVEMVSEA